ncbi:bifunctional helix-turn-helix transcriptional regulator/GNAT family N-acetyltransferase [Sphingomonas sp. AR_OL41]|jgi:DNA-binding MarR family transcriptional regulator/ribosomal protein S18 acetylase RimI-like enzyme|uniref:bifunctional helix-turn-helix transcriptional regulator/GNAT family N-acetyltransferase n=1 Tax=Sphingomonas sp. AR_OL41 TaxID=3042729 RepID=UPI00247FF684|nr:bifunctional helix-turn-helix transcriptional regulator/GNAT family N-acetyltransferase [Sphingomonas sp. AR_OL41]MDH7972681.1 bifunctional helix-turn-helix transcriptional regulator/GNAT family N-acetyltransferase [Sphingomonas sp. AR_OL41]
MSDVVAEMGPVFLGSRLKRLAERLQGDAAHMAEAAGLPVQPSQMPLLTTLDRHGPLTVGAAVEMLGISQPAVTRILSRLVSLGLVETSRAHRDQRQKTIALTAAGDAVMARVKAVLWPMIASAVADLCGAAPEILLDQVAAIERALAEAPLDRRPGPTILDYSDALAPDFYSINAAWIETMFAMEDSDREVLLAPREKIIAPGGAILFAAVPGLGVVGTCALRKTGEGQFELTKMGVLESARGRKIGEFLLAAAIARARAMGVETLYLLTNARCAPAIHLYEKAGFVHDSWVKETFGARYQRCDVAMLYHAPA